MNNEVAKRVTWQFYLQCTVEKNCPRSDNGQKGLGGTLHTG